MKFFNANMSLRRKEQSLKYLKPTLDQIKWREHEMGRSASEESPESAEGVKLVAAELARIVLRRH